MIVDLIHTSLIQGLCLSFVALGIFIPFRLLHTPDLTAEGSYPFGGVLFASTLMYGAHPLTGFLLAGLFAGLLGAISALLHVRLKLNVLLCGILVSIMAYSFNLRLLGKPNVALFQYSNWFLSASNFYQFLFLFLLWFFCVLPLFIFLYTTFGLRLRAVGYNSSFALQQGICIDFYVVLGFFLGSFYVGAGSSLMVQLQGYVDVGMGTGIAIHALAALMIGERLMRPKTLQAQLASPLLGALAYEQIQGLVLFLGLAPSDLKLVTALAVIGLMALPYKAA